MQSLLSSMRSKPVTMLLHLALAIIIVGACVTHFFGMQGEIHLRADKAQTLTYKSPYSASFSSLEGRLGGVSSPTVSLFLWDFQIVYAEDGKTPVDYITELRLLDRSKPRTANGELPVDEGTIRMNKPLKYNGFRFCQSDYDSDLMGVVLTYNYDPWGIGITYTGYALLLISMIAFFFRRNTIFRAKLKQSVFAQRSDIYSAAFIALIAILALVMTKVVTPKPPLQPVLQTPLLGIHVSVIMLAYTLFAIIAINGIVGLCMHKSPTTSYKLQIVSQVLLYPAIFCLAAGIFIGAVWANLSWGRYWGWDPKETWALITMIVYACQLHWPLIIGKLKLTNNKAQTIYHIISVVNFLFVLFTYFGVNRLLGGLHSYA